MYLPNVVAGDVTGNDARERSNPGGLPVRRLRLRRQSEDAGVVEEVS